jgi:triacylglycerol lipase
MTEQLRPDVIAQLKTFGTAITPELAQKSWALLTPFLEKIGYTAPRIARDLSYGDDPRHLLDVHTADPAESATRAPAPVFVFVHGGGFVGGEKHTPGTPRYDTVGAWAVRHGWVGVNITYRLAPEHKWPAGAQDLAAAVAWIRDNIAAYGGDPGKIVVSGNSAGAVHVASYVTGQGADKADKADKEASLDGVRGAAMLSGIYEIAQPRPGEPEHAYYGANPDQAVSTLSGLLDCQVPLLFSVAEYDPDHFQRAAAGLAAAWFARHGTMPHLIFADGHNHMSTIASLGIDESSLDGPLARFVTRVTADPQQEA